MYNLKSCGFYNFTRRILGERLDLFRQGACLENALVGRNRGACALVVGVREERKIDSGGYRITIAKGLFLNRELLQ